MLANGYADEMLYERGMIETFGLPCPELNRRAHIDERARTVGDGELEFAARIRTHFTKSQPAFSGQ